MNPLTGDLPLHPALVHLPLGLALVMPLLTVALLAGRRWFGPPVVGLVAVLQLVLVAGAVVAKETGEDAEGPAKEQGAPRAVIHEHEERAELFTVLAGLGFLALAGSTAAGTRRAAVPLLGAASVLSLATAVQGARTGHEGGELVYEYGAGVEKVGEKAGEPAVEPTQH